ncbi:hypothetical protein Poly51_09460 [Rubripirellula tenax]|uniref:Ice-binding protein C-terminal domain-containing protein n=1 Tax=Rubripirellula tenax TaxID=2528015 RepID=A0A5C6FFX5_9BACT|nr:PEP-CTERM sorting domain-containing protein [Rubripirellula tenax]TWU60666.1 hypothetical protein Poly51_09460 [Rubripirellula tenax]
MRSLSLLIVVVFQIPVSAVVIDSFRVGSQVVSTGSNVAGSSSIGGLDPNEVLFGKRTLTLRAERDSGPLFSMVDTSGTGSLRYMPSLSFQLPPNDRGRIELTHLPGNGVETFDISQYANSNYVIDFEHAGFGGTPSFGVGPPIFGVGPVDALLRVSSTTGSDSVAFSIFESFAPFQVLVPMSGLSNADLSNAYNLTLDIEGIPSQGTLKISQISFATAVPEPSSFLFLAAAGLAVGLIKFRERIKGQERIKER